MPAMTDELKALLYAGRAKGISLVRLGKMHGVSKKTVQRATESFVYQAPRKLTTDQEAEVFRLFKAGNNRAQLAERYGVANGTIGRAIRNAKNQGVVGLPAKGSRWKGALCLEEKPSLFEYDPLEWPGRTPEEWQLDIEYAMDVCIECPLMVRCGAEANAEDREWSVRGGLPPKRYARDFDL